MNDDEKEEAWENYWYGCYHGKIPSIITPTIQAIIKNVYLAGIEAEENWQRNREMDDGK
jgi:hypothetical protein